MLCPGKQGLCHWEATSRVTEAAITPAAWIF